MSYARNTIARRLLDEDPEAVGQVMRWISAALTTPRFWVLHDEWPDLLQEVLARVLESLQEGRFDGSRDLRVYVQGIARFVSLESLVRRRREVPSPDGRSSVTGAFDAESWVISRQLVRRVLDLASKDCRQLIQFYFYEARSYDEIGQVLEVPSGTVKSRLFRCLQGAHQSLARRGRLRRSRTPAR